MNGPRLSYRDAGVDLSAADALKDRFRELVESTRTGGVRSAFGSFGGRFRLDEASDLVASADGVGTKLKVAFRTGRHGTVGEDLVNHCVNDILTEGAEPLFFLDYFACGELRQEVALRVVEGIARGCRISGCALLGGETAEMPGFYPPGEYDLAGFLVGRLAYPEVAARSLKPGDRLLGLAASGLHTNGYSFAREVVFERLGLGVTDPWPGLEAAGAPTVGDVLLRVHRAYLPCLREVCASGRIRGLAHVTGGGIPGNLRRVLPGDLDARIETDSWEPSPEFRVLAEESGAPPEEMFRVFNMGIGMIAAVRASEMEEVRSRIEANGCPAFPCGELVEGSGKVWLEGSS